ncbi:thioredoxin domain-containing protein, partial [Candidatus Falkowbacteria bacterium]|nr:thioredoxin domain-containing protein [Candidatus Falkowbacteria bacterium]
MENETQPTPQTETQKPNPYLVPFAIVVAGIIIAGAVMYSQAPRGGGGAAGVPSEQKVNIKDVDLKGEPFIGNAQAPVTLAYWLDFQCPFCQRFDLQTLPVLAQMYVNTGKLKVVFKDFQFLGPDSQTAGLAAHAVWELY